VWALAPERKISHTDPLSRGLIWRRTLTRLLVSQFISAHSSLFRRQSDPPPITTAQQAALRIRVGLPDIQEIGVTRSSHNDAFLARCPVQGRTDVLFAVRQSRQGNLERRPRLQMIDIVQQTSHNALVLAIPSLEHVHLTDLLKTRGINLGMCRISF
jgi:hypothetical protein